MRILALDAALARCSVALVQDGAVVAALVSAAGRGQQGMLAAMVARVLEAAPGFDAHGFDAHGFDAPGSEARGFDAPGFGAVAVTVGPGSFTGLRTAISLAHGLGSGRVPVVGVTVAEAFAEAVGETSGRAIWTAIDSRRGRVFLDVGGRLAAFSLSALPVASGPVVVAGDAAIAVAARLAAVGGDVRLSDARAVDAVCVARVGVRRIEGGLAALAAQPLYVDAPEAKLPAGGLRPRPGS